MLYVCCYRVLCSSFKTKKRACCHMSHVICHFVFMRKLKSDCLSCCHMSHFTCHMSYIKCWCWSLGHAEQLLFSCLVCSKVTVYRWKWQWFFYIILITRAQPNHRAGSRLNKNVWKSRQKLWTRKIKKFKIKI